MKTMLFIPRTVSMTSVGFVRKEEDDTIQIDFSPFELLTGKWGLVVNIPGDGPQGLITSQFGEPFNTDDLQLVYRGETLKVSACQYDDDTLCIEIDWITAKTSNN